MVVHDRRTVLIVHPWARFAFPTLQKKQLPSRRSVKNLSDVRHSPVTGSAGLAQCHGGESIVAAIERADQAVYRAKAAGRNRLVSA